MDWLTFVARFVEAVAWPVAVLVMMSVLRKPLGSLIPFLQRLKYKDLELEFGRQIEEVRQEVQAELPVAAPDRAIQASAAAESLSERLAELSPRSAVLEAWRQIEDALLRAAQRRQAQVRWRQGEPPLWVIKGLERAQILDPSKVGILRDLRALRNSAAHGPDFALSKDSAIEYARVAAQLVEYLNGL